jgi:hypothetical protein
MYLSIPTGFNFMFVYIFKCTAAGDLIGYGKGVEKVPVAGEERERRIWKRHC